MSKRTSRQRDTRGSSGRDGKQGSGSFDDPLLAPLPKILKVQAQLPSLTTTPAETVRSTLVEMVQSEDADNADAIVHAKTSNKVVMLDNPPSKKAEKPPKAKSTLSNRRRKEIQLLDIPTANQKYDLYLPLHDIWTGYIRSLLGKISKQASLRNLETKISKADYHGAMLSVIRHTNPLMVGVTGIVLQESENAFRIIKKNDSLLLIPKTNAVFSFVLDGLVFNLYGNNLRWERLVCQHADRIVYGCWQAIRHMHAILCYQCITVHVAPVGSSINSAHIVMHFRQFSCGVQAQTE
eukprot:TRINITY_DN10692_c0_g1_i5.p2 TRINITY_DN10692_c0_g1~~TRINITY_DN10692_c0_g1_i5.p2  ORF type:complete len:294 (+),score=33.81 TRINITY_DN10692_c0_g1_i5:1459-2340(+)